MAGTKFFGPVGYGTSVETPAGGGVWVKTIVERPYYGDIVRNARRLRDGERVNNEITVGNSISIVADPFAFGHFMEIVYVTWMGARWEVESVEVLADAPRLMLRLGGVYNGPIAE